MQNEHSDDFIVSIGNNASKLTIRWKPEYTEDYARACLEFIRQHFIVTTLTITMGEGCTPDSISPIFEGLQETSIEELNLCGYDMPSANSFLMHILRSEKLKRVRFSQCNLVCMDQFFHGVRDTPSITDLVFEQCKIEMTASTSHNRTAWEGLTYGNPSLRLLMFWKCEVEPRALSWLAWGLRSNTVLQSFSFDDMYVDSSDRAGVFHAILHCNLKHLNLRGLGIHSKEFRTLMHNIHQRKTITHLDVAGNLLGATGIYQIFLFIECGTLIESLNIADCHASKWDTDMFRAALRKTKTLRRLILSGNQLGDDVAAALADALRENESIHWLSLVGTALSEEGEAAVVDALLDNDTITSFPSDIQGPRYDSILKKLKENRARLPSA